MQIDISAPAGKEHKFYCPISPCINGHRSVRRISTNKCLQCERDASSRREKRDMSSYSKAHYIKNRDKYLERNKRHRENNPDYQKKWREKTGFKQVKSPSIAMNRRARLANAGGKCTKRDIEFLKDKQSMKCATCKTCLIKAGMHIDHVIPIFLGGTGDLLNLQLLCPTCNRRKGKMHPIDWANKNGLLC